MPFFTHLQIGFRNLIQARRRSLILGSAIAFVALLMVLLLGVSQGVADRLVETATSLSSGHVNVAGFFKPRGKTAEPVIMDRDKIRKLVKEKIAGVEAVTDRNRGWGRIIGPESSINTGVNGIIFAEEERLFKTLTLASGSFDGLKKPDSALIFAAQAKKLGVALGDTITFITEANGGQTNTVDLTIVAVAKDLGFMSNWNVFVPRETLLSIYKRGPDTTGAVMLYLDDIDRSEKVIVELRKVLSEAGYSILDHDPKPFFMKFDKIGNEDWKGLRLDLTTWRDEVSFILFIVTSLQALSVFLIGILSIIIATGIANSLWMTVRERTKEIGTVRAIGMQKRAVIGLFLTEAGLLGLIAATIGGLLGALVVVAVNAAQIPIPVEGMRVFLMTEVLRLALHPAQIITTIVTFTLLTGAAALYPAWRASRLRPVVALMHSK